MKYWTMFTLSMLTRVGLFLAVLLWLVCQTRQFSSGYVSFSTWSVSVTADIEKLIVDVIDAPRLGADSSLQDVRTAMTEWLSLPTVRLPGTTFGFYGQTAARLTLHHWLLCLTFLTAAVATSVRWRKHGSKSDQERTNE